MRYLSKPSILKDIAKDLMLWLDDVYFGRFRTINTTEVNLEALSEDPGDPINDRSVMWQSDGTETGDAGDIIVKITVSGVTKTTTLIDYSTL